LIERIPGKGTFVSKDKIQESLIKELLGFHEDTLLRGHKPSTKILHQQYLPATQEIAAKLGLSPGDPVFYLKRLRYVDGEPHLVSQTYLRAEQLPGIIDVDFNQDSLYVTLSNLYGVKIQHGKRVVEAILATEEDSQLLGIQAGAAILLLTSLVFQENGQPIEFSVGKHRADRTKFEVDLIRTKDELNLSSEANRTQHVP
jgi:GntR family transcriptional regulator